MNEIFINYVTTRDVRKEERYEKEVTPKQPRCFTQYSLLRQYK